MEYSSDHLVLFLCRQELQRQYEQVILLDLELVNKHNIEQMLWKSAFYQVIEFLRKNTLDALMGEAFKQHLTTLLEEVHTKND